MKTLQWLLRGNAIQLVGLVCLIAAGLALPMYAGAEELPAYPLTVGNGHFSPEILNIPAGQRFKIVVTNKGPGPEEFESVELKKETVLAPGVTRAVVFAPLKPGIYKFFGDFHPETAKGQIVVK